MKLLLPAVTAAVAVLGVAACGATALQVRADAPAAGPAATLVPSAAAPASPAAATAAQCTAASLRGSAGPAQGTAGSLYVTLVLTNVSGATCTMRGYPGVSQAAGTPAADLGQPSSESPATPRELVTLAPGGTAHVTLQIADAGNFPASQCTPVRAGSLAVVPPDQTAPVPVTFSSVACAGAAKLLTVTAVRPGTGS